MFKTRWNSSGLFTYLCETPSRPDGHCDADEVNAIGLERVSIPHSSGPVNQESVQAHLNGFIFIQMWEAYQRGHDPWDNPAEGGGGENCWVCKRKESQPMM